MYKILLTIFTVLTTLNGYSQFKNSSFQLEGQVGFTSPKAVPFWLRSNQYGSVPLAGLSNSWIISAEKDYDSTRNRIVDWGASFEGRANVGKNSNLTIIEGLGKVKLWIFELKGGRVKDRYGLNDSLLSTGNFAISGNALGIPKVQISIPDYYTIPILGNILGIKGVYAHGWVGEKLIQFKRVNEAKTFFHQKAIYGRFGLPAWRAKLYAGFSDQAFWGNEAKIFESFILTDWESYKYVIFGRDWAQSKVGNHVGNVDLRFEYEFDKISIAAYRQSFYEVGALYHLANVADGVNGVSFVNREATEKKVKWQRFVFEFIYSKNQAGEPWSKPTPSGNENYYNHNLYEEGWSFKGVGLGNPLMTPEIYARAGQPNVEKNYFINNRIVAFHIGSQVIFGKWHSLSKLTFSRNYGTHHTRTTFQPVSQFSAFVEASRSISSHVNIGFVGAFDVGKLLNNSGGLQLKISKSF